MKSKGHLDVSKEALWLLKTIKPGHNDLGEVDWFATSDGNHAFGWMGRPYNITTLAGVKNLRHASDGRTVIFIRHQAESTRGSPAPQGFQDFSSPLTDLTGHGFRITVD